MKNGTHKVVGADITFKENSESSYKRIGAPKIRVKYRAKCFV